MNRKNELARLASIPALFAGVTLGWLTSAMFFRASDVVTVPIALIVLCVVVSRELRWWKCVKQRIPASIVVGALTVFTFIPTVQGDFQVDSVSDLLRLAGPFSTVNWVLIGATIALGIVFVCTPLDN